MNIEETREEILLRTNVLKKKRERRIEYVLKGATVSLLVLLIALVPFLPISGSVSNVSGNYATLIIGSEVGAYILVGIICFLIGVVITLLAVKKREDRE